MTMLTTVHKPKGVLVRHFPTARAIADRLMAEPALLALSTALLAGDIRRRFGVSDCTARTAVAFARKGGGGAG